MSVVYYAARRSGPFISFPFDIALLGLFLRLYGHCSHRPPSIVICIPYFGGSRMFECSLSAAVSPTWYFALSLRICAVLKSSRHTCIPVLYRGCACTPCPRSFTVRRVRSRQNSFVRVSWARSSSSRARSRQVLFPALALESSNRFRPLAGVSVPSRWVPPVACSSPFREANAPPCLASA